MKEPEQLSIAQLKQMNGWPVRYGRTGEWFIVSLQHPDFGDCIINAGGYYLPLATAAERGVYGYAPAVLSKEEWTAHWNVKESPWTGYTMVCSKCDGKIKSLSGQLLFCPACGRAMTEEAWKILKKRWEGKERESEQHRTQREDATGKC